MHTITESTLQSLIANINHPAYGPGVASPANPCVKICNHCERK
ncbi:hypothetical protein FHR87_000940 [Azomonas macrocytogenes]|uniref:Uncharacterized protein n=1 Tax=Azomonas macrocytogenes TaxID=69962 RepID=A0A839SYZ0_AZOMA|nr:hypothetical protein [Azomonas macrocytogenes]